MPGRYIVKAIINANKNLYLNIVGSFSIKGLALIINFFTIPLYMSYFKDNSILGVWYTILSFLSWVLMFDLGIGNGLRNHLVKPLLQDDKITIKKLFSSAYIVLGLISILIVIIGSFIIFNLNWNTIFNISSNVIKNEYLQTAFFVSFMGIVIQFFLKIVLSILNAMEKTALSNAITLISSFINLVYLLVFKQGNDITRLFNLSFVYALSVNIPLVICSLILFLTKFRDSIPNINYFDKNMAKSIVNLGVNFFVIQILFMLITGSNEFFISNLFGADKVVEFQVYNKVFYTLVTLFSLISNPIWSAVARAKSEEDFNRVKNLFKKLLLFVGCAILCVVIIALIFQPLVIFWLGDNSIIVNNSYLFAFVLYVCVMLFVFALNSVANGLQVLYPQIICYSFAVLIKFLLLFIFKIQWSSWIIVIWINTITLIPYVVWQLFDFKNLLFFKEAKKENKKT